MAGHSLAQESPFKLSGKIGNLDAPSRIYLTYKKDGGHKYDSAVLKQGRFLISGRTKDPFYGVLVIDYKGVGLLNLDRRSPQDIFKVYIDNGPTGDYRPLIRPINR